MSDVLPVPAAASKTILIVEDDPDLQRLLHFNVESAGYRAVSISTGEPAVRATIDHRPALMLLDLMLPDLSGIEVCRRIRALQDLPQPAIVMLTARSTEMDRVAAFEVGADDYVVKPFSVRELMLRVAARLKNRFAPAWAPPRPAINRPRLKAGALELDPEGHHAYVDGREVAVTAVEMRILVHLFQGRGLVHSRPRMLADVWGYTADIQTRTVDTHIKRLRDKLGPAGVLIETVRGLGYRLADDEPIAGKVES